MSTHRVDWGSIGKPPGAPLLAAPALLEARSFRESEGSHPSECRDRGINHTCNKWTIPSFLSQEPGKLHEFVGTSRCNMDCSELHVSDENRKTARSAGPTTTLLAPSTLAPFSPLRQYCRFCRGLARGADGGDAPPQSGSRAPSKLRNLRGAGEATVPRG